MAQALGAALQEHPSLLTPAVRSPETQYPNPFTQCKVTPVILHGVVSPETPNPETEAQVVRELLPLVGLPAPLDEQVILNPTSQTLHPTPYTLNPKPYTLNPKPYTLNPKPDILNPKSNP